MGRILEKGDKFSKLGKSCGQRRQAERKIGKNLRERTTLKKLGKKWIRKRKLRRKKTKSGKLEKIMDKEKERKIGKT